MNPGDALGPYRVVSELGVGGMGEVYRAHDTRLGRDVALKFLPEAVAGDGDRLVRFEREAKALATLNHPNIAHLYGLEDSGGVRALVMELVEGEDLSQRLARGPLPLAEALGVARQVAEALEAAHAQGIVHRDLKPANVKLRPDGTVKVLDFGLAKALDTSTRSPEGSHSPTMTSADMTGVGTVLGTPAYMSPEQALGDVVDRGADIWAFGCLVHEMLAGTPVFAGKTAADVREAVIRSEPSWTHLPPDTPEGIRRMLRRCLARNRRQRLADIRDARLDIDEVGKPSEAVRPRDESGRRRRLTGLAALVLLAAVAATALLWRVPRVSEDGALAEVRAEISTPPTTDQVSLAISPDGRKLVFVASAGGEPRLWLRPLDADAAQPLEGTEGASFPFWSPDSRSVAFFASETLRRFEISGSSPKVVTRVPLGTGGAWSREGVIVLPVVPDSPLFRVPATGGAPATLGTPPPGEGRSPGERFPQFLPDGRHFLYYVAESRGVFLGTLDGPERRRLFDAGAAAVFAPPSQVLFVRGTSLFAQRFDPTRLAIEGEPTRVADDVAVDALGAAAVSASAVGSLVFRTGSANQPRTLIWHDRAGNHLGAPAGTDPSRPTNPTLSPDGRHVALNRTMEGNADIWLLDVDRGVYSRFTSERGPEFCPVWSADGDELLYAKSAASGMPALFRKSTTGSGGEQALLNNDLPAVPMDWSRDGGFVLYRTLAPATGWDIWALPMQGDRAPIAVAGSAFDERTAQFAPDVRWIAYESNESGRFEIYVQPFPGPGRRQLVSNGGGSQVRWRADGRELFYVAPDGRLVSVPVGEAGVGAPLALGEPTPLFSSLIGATVSGGTCHAYAVSADGQRFLMNTMGEQRSPITLVLHRGGR